MNTGKPCRRAKSTSGSYDRSRITPLRLGPLCFPARSFRLFLSFYYPARSFAGTEHFYQGGNLTDRYVIFAKNSCFLDLRLFCHTIGERKKRILFKKGSIKNGENEIGASIQAGG